jgi:hypothetical protein
MKTRMMKMEIEDRIRSKFERFHNIINRHIIILGKLGLESVHHFRYSQLEHPLIPLSRRYLWSYGTATPYHHVTEALDAAAEKYWAGM